MFIYKITNKINGKIYIGQTTRSISKRWTEHCKPSSKSCPVLISAIRKYRIENFKVEEIDGANSLSELNYLEKHYIYKFNSLSNKNGYNMSKGGSGNNLGHSKETKDKLSKYKGNKHWAFGKKMSNEHKEKIKISNLNNTVSKETKDKLSKYKGNKHWAFGKKMSNNTKDKISKSQKGKKREQIFFTKEVYCINNNKIYKSIKEAGVDLNIDTSHIGSVCKGTRKSTYGYKFTFNKSKNK